jgi:hypothetical protein
MSQDELEARKKKAERGWLADPPSPAPRPYIPGEENKWLLMMGARQLLEQKRERERRAAQDIAVRYGYLKIQDSGRGEA